MNTTLLSTGLGTTSSITMYTTDDEKIIPERRNEVIATTLASTVTTAVSSTVQDMTVKKIHEKYTSAYVDSMTDEELERALTKMNLLLADEEQKTKTL